VNEWIVMLFSGIGVFGMILGISTAWRADRRIGVLRRLEADEAVPTVERRRSVPAPILEVITELAPSTDPQRSWRYGRIVAGIVVIAALLQSPVPTLLLVAGSAAAFMRHGRRPRGGSGDRDVAGDAELLASRIATGADPLTALRTVADGGDPDWGIVFDDVANGAPLQVSLDRWADEGDDPRRRLLADAWAVAGSTGSGIAPALVRAATTAREHADVDGEIDALTAQARLSARVLTVVPLGFAGPVAIVDDRVAAFMFGTTAGQLSIVVGLTLCGLGSRWMRHLVEAAR